MAEVSNQVIDARCKALEDKLESLKKSVDGAAAPVFPHRDGGFDSGYVEWSEEDAPRQILKHNNSDQYAVKTDPRFHKQVYIPKGYKPHEFYKPNEGGQFFHDVIREKIRPGSAERLHALEKNVGYQTLRKAVQGMSEGIGADGGWAVVPEFSQTIFTRAYENSLLEMTDSYGVAGNSMVFPRNAETSRLDGQREGGTLAYWVQEGGTLTSSKPTVNQLALKLKKVAVVVYLTEELIADAGQSLEAYVTRKAGNEFNFQIGNAIFAGQGTGRPQGLLYSNATIQVAAETNQATKTILAANIANMWRRMYAGSWNNAVWFINQNTLTMNGLLGMTIGVGTGGVAVYTPPGGLSSSPYATLMGRPVLPLEFCPPLGTPGDITLADMSHYVTITKGGVQQAQSIHVEFLTDQLALRFIMRVDGETWENAPVVPYQGSSTTDTQSSFITLAAR